MKYLYLVRSGDHVKIGIATDLEKRLKGLATGNPLPVTVVCYFTANDAARIEQLLHSTFAHKRHNLEWFSLDDNDIQLAETVCMHAGARKMPPYDPKKKPANPRTNGTYDLEIAQQMLGRYQEAGHDLRITNVNRENFVGTAIYLKDVFFCERCRNMSIGDRCLKCPPL